MKPKAKCDECLRKFNSNKIKFFKGKSLCFWCIQRTEGSRSIMSVSQINRGIIFKSYLIIRIICPDISNVIYSKLGSGSKNIVPFISILI